MERALEWTASPRSVAAAPALSKVTLRWLVSCTLCLSFLMALLQYAIRSSLSQFAHLGLFLGAGLLVLCGRRRGERIQNLFASGSFAVLIAAMMFGEAISYTAHDNYSTLYGLIFIAVIVAARLIVQEIGLAGVMRAYSQAAILTVSFLCTVDFRQIRAGTAERFNGSGGVHPNLVGFVLAGFLPVLVWRALEYKVAWRRRAATGLALATFGVIFLTGSRGALSSVIGVGIFFALRGFLRRSWLARIRLNHAMLITAFCLVPLLFAFLIQHNRIGHFAGFLASSLELNSSQRGIKSGLSGRTNIWSIALHLLRRENRWLIGFGYRAGDRLVGTIDDGYIQLLFESGLIAGSMILGCMLRTFVLLLRASKVSENNAWTRYYTILWCFMLIYFLGNVSTRYLFSFGSSFSLAILLMMVASRRELVGSTMRGRPDLPAMSRTRGMDRPAWTRLEQ